MGVTLRKGLGPVKRVVVKLGSRAVTREEGGVSTKNLRKIVRDLAELQTSGFEIIIISSGAIQAGREDLALSEDHISHLQALSSLGQPKLMHSYRSLFKRSGINVAQVLLTHEDFRSRPRYLNGKNTLSTLIQEKVIPILNENDATSFTEIALGDNDQLAVKIALMLESDLLVMLTETDGLLERAPRNGEGKRLPYIHHKRDYAHISTTGKSAVGRGGMKEKLRAIERANRGGLSVVLGSYKKRRPLYELLVGEGGTVFFPTERDTGKKARSKKVWLASASRPEKALLIDAGAMRALRRGASLLPSGIVGSRGDIRRGDCVCLILEGKVVGHGLTEYSGKEIDRIAGRRGSEIASLLGFCPSKVVVHRNNMAMEDL